MVAERLENRPVYRPDLRLIKGSGVSVVEKKDLAVRLVVEEPNDERSAEKQLAYDCVDVSERYRKLLDRLSPREVLEIVKQDEIKMVEASLAEVAELSVYPYQLVMIGGEVGSLVKIDGDSGEKIWVFRNLLDMLESRVKKFPDDKRSQTVLSGFKEGVVPVMRSLAVGQSLTYFSPPDSENEGGLEGGYGFAYVLKKVLDPETELSGFEAMSIKLNWAQGDYLKALNIEESVTDLGPDYYWRVVNSVLEVTDKTLDLETVASKVTGQFNEDWFSRQLDAYTGVKEFVKQRQEKFIDRVMSGNPEELKKVMQELQLEWLVRVRPEVYEQIRNEVAMYGVSQIMVSCGLLEFGSGFANGLEMIQRGDLPLNGECRALKCTACGNTEVKEGDTECRVCGWAPGKSVEEYRNRLQQKHRPKKEETKIENRESKNKREVKLKQKNKNKKENLRAINKNW
jgi:hypothetical protein